MKVDLTPCYILHKRNYRESSLLLEIFSREHGRLSLIAKGAKKNKKQQNISFNSYQKFNMSWSVRSDLGTLIDIEPCEICMLDPEKIMSGFYLNEITLRLLHKHEPHPELFDAYDKAIVSLSRGLPVSQLLRYYEKSILQSLGYGMVLDVDVNTGEEIFNEKEYYYQFDYGPSLTHSKENYGVTVSGQTLIELQNENLSEPETIKEAKFLLKSLLKQYLGDKPLESRELYHAYLSNKNN